jgi:peptide/nickel transport system permease protein
MSDGSAVPGSLTGSATAENGRRGLGHYVARRIGTSALLLVLLSLFVFVGAALLPGDPVTARLGPTASPDQIAQAQARLGLGRPVVDRYLDWAGGLLHGDLGTSLLSGQQVGPLVAERLGNSVVLAVITLLLVVPLSMAIGGWAGVKRGSRIDRGVLFGTVMLVAVPEYILAGLLVLVFAISLEWVPAVSLVPAGDSPLQHPDVLVLPVASLLLLSLAYSVRVIRASTAAALRAPHVTSARLNGVGFAVVLRRAVLPAVLPVAVQIWSILGVGLVGGTVLVERVYGYPGVGEQLVASVQTGDLPVIQALAMVLGAAMLIALLVADIAVVLLTPKLRTAA